MAKTDFKRQSREEMDVVQKPRISVLMPAFEEEGHIEETIQKVAKTLEEVGESFEVVVVNDGSGDGTGKILKEFTEGREYLKLVSYGDNRGKGFALKKGFHHVEGDLVFFVDADSDLNPERIHRFLGEMEARGSDIVIGSKRHPESEVNYPLKRTILSRGYSILLRVLFGLGVTDTQVGMKLFRREVLDEVMPLILVKRYAFDVEILSLAKRKGYTVTEAPVEIHFEPEFSNISWTAVAHMAWDTAAVFYRLKILRYYQKREKEVKGLKILLYNWRGPNHPDAGGAEVFTHEVLKRLVDRGHEATWFTSRPDGAGEREVIDGIEIVRSGGRFTVYREAKKHYRRELRGKYDVVVDEINTRPFMTPKYVKDTPIVALIHQLAREFWFHETPFPINRIGYHFLENRWLKLYKETPTMTVSNSTRKDLKNLSFTDITVVPEGVSHDPLEQVPEKPDEPTLLFVGRMTEAKRPGHALAAFNELHKEYPEAELHMVGDGYLMDDLRREANGSVTFHGYLSEEEKLELMQRSHLLLAPGVREGWGLVVTEANSQGTPAVGYDVPGLRDSIDHGRTGLVTDPEPESLAHGAERLLQNGLEEYAKNALEDSRQYDWDRTADAVERRLTEVA